MVLGEMDLGQVCIAPARPACLPTIGLPAGGTSMLLENKNAVSYGVGGAIGGGVAKAFAPRGRQGLAGRAHPPGARRDGQPGHRCWGGRRP
jgi:hypothetical protein